jgi:hypothetical protein
MKKRLTMDIRVKRPLYCRQRQTLTGLVLIISALLSLSSCSERELDQYPTSRSLSIYVDWKNLFTGDVQPTSLTLNFYNSLGTLVESVNPTTNPVDVELSTGEYRVLAFNTDGQNVSLYKPEVWDSAAVSLTPVLTQNLSVRSSSGISQPSNVYAFSLGSYEVNGGLVAKKDTFLMQDQVKRFTVNVLLEGADTLVTGCSSTLSGLSTMLRLSIGNAVSGYSGTLNFTSTPIDGGFSSTIRFFEIESTQTQNLAVTLQYEDGTTQTTTQDISTAIREAISSPTVIKLDLKFTISVSSLEGISATLTDWTTEEGEITL